MCFQVLSVPKKTTLIAGFIYTNYMGVNDNLKVEDIRNAIDEYIQLFKSLNCFSDHCSILLPWHSLIRWKLMSIILGILVMAYSS
jgi:hypothetical protein